VKRFPDGVPLLDPIEDMKVEDGDFKKVVRKLEMIEDKLLNNEAFSKSTDIQTRYDNYKRKLELEEEIKVSHKSLKHAEDVILKHELKCMKRVLRRLGFTNLEDIVDVKGRVACEINAADTLLLTELMFTGFFNELSVEHTVAALSCFVFQEKGEETPKAKEELMVLYRTIQDVSRRIGKISQECKLNLDLDAYVREVNGHMMEVTNAWAGGAKFIEICQMSDIFEGSLIRAMRRLEELLRELTTAAKSIGNTALETKFNEGITKIKRDIVFAASLYL